MKSQNYKAARTSRATQKIRHCEELRSNDEAIFFFEGAKDCFAKNARNDDFE